MTAVRPTVVAPLKQTLKERLLGDVGGLQSIWGTAAMTSRQLAAFELDPLAEAERAERRRVTGTVGTDMVSGHGS